MKIDQVETALEMKVAGDTIRAKWGFYRGELQDFYQWSCPGLLQHMAEGFPKAGQNPH